MSFPPLSVNRLAAVPLARLVDEAERLRVAVSHDERGVTIIDAGIAVEGSVEAGLLTAEICLGGLGEVRLLSGSASGFAGWPSALQVRSSQPVLACLGSQYAGWSLSASKEETGGKKFFALGSGPARALAAKEALFDELAWRDTADQGVIVLEVDRLPPAVIIDKLLRDCRLAPEGLSIVLTPTTSLAGTTQVVARVLEVALHRAHALGFALEHIVEGSAAAPAAGPQRRRCARRWAAPTTPSSTAARCTSPCGARPTRPAPWPGPCRLRIRPTMASRLPSCSPRRATISTRSTARCLPRPRCGSATWARGQTWHAGRVDMDLLLRLWGAQA